MITSALPTLLIMLELNTRLGFAHDAPFTNELRSVVGTALDMLLRDFAIPLELTVDLTATELEMDFNLFIAGSSLGISRQTLSKVAEALEESGQVSGIDSRRYLLQKSSRVEGTVLKGIALQFLTRAVVAGLAQQLEYLVNDRVAAVYLGVDADGQRMDVDIHGPSLQEVCWIMKAILQTFTPLGNRKQVVRLIHDGRQRKLGPEVIAETIIARLRPGTLDIEIDNKYAEALIGQLGDKPVSVESAGLAARQLAWFNGLIDGIFYEMGIRTPPIRLRAREDLPSNTFVFRINHLVTAPLRGLAANQLLVNDTVDRLSLLNIEGTPTINPANGFECAIIANESGAIAEDAGLTMWEPLEYLILALGAEVRRNAHCLIDVDAVEYELALLGETFPDIVAEWRQEESLACITRVLRTLLRQGVSIRNLRSVLHLAKTYDCVLTDSTEQIVLDDRLAIDEKTPATNDTVEYTTAFVRKAFRHYLGYKYSRGSNTIAVYLLDPTSVERPILADGWNLAAQRVEAIRRAIDDQVGQLPPSAVSPLILTTASVALHLRSMLASCFPQLPILAYQELSPDLSIQPIARITLDDLPRNVQEGE